jgi:hypothetical protein
MTFDKTTGFVVIGVVLLLVALVVALRGGRVKGRIPGLNFDAEGPPERSNIDLLTGLHATDLEAGNLTGRSSPSSKPGDIKILSNGVLERVKLGDITGEGGGTAPKTPPKRDPKK